ncbi:MAG TPA: hypothetical protein VIF62_00735 [Labilithrix sp.]|jgi:hypothetical protein
MRKLVLSLCSAALATTVAMTAHADETSGKAIDWGRLLVGLDSYVRHGSESVQQESKVAEEHTQSQLYVHNAGNAWFGVAPSVTLVARDWGEAYRLAGDRLSLTDAMRLSSSTRMVVARVRLSDSHLSRVTPFAQLGAGQWRTDTNLMPILYRSTEVAAQVGGGVELRLSRRWQVAWETTATLLIRDYREDDAISATKLWSTTLASRLEW